MSCLLSTFVSKIIAFMEGKKKRTKYAHSGNRDLTPSQSVCMHMHNAFLHGKSALTMFCFSFLCVENIWNQKHIKNCSRYDEFFVFFFFYSAEQPNNRANEYKKVGMDKKNEMKKRKWASEHKQNALPKKKCHVFGIATVFFSFSSVVQFFICKTMHNAKSASYIKK